MRRLDYGGSFHIAKLDVTTWGPRADGDADRPDYEGSKHSVEENIPLQSRIKLHLAVGDGTLQHW
jgi:hypothetical protein